MRSAPVVLGPRAEAVDTIDRREDQRLLVEGCPVGGNAHGVERLGSEVPGGETATDARDPGPAIPEDWRELERAELVGISVPRIRVRQGGARLGVKNAPDHGLGRER